MARLAAASPAEGGGGSGGEELVVCGDRLKRASGERWGRRKEEAFLAELAGTGNLRLACAAVGISKQAIRRRRRNDPVFDAACDAAIAECRARIPEFLAGAAAATFDPDTLTECGTNPLPKMSIDQAIKIAQLWGPPRAKADSAEAGPGVEPYDVEEVRQRLEEKMRMLKIIGDEELARACPNCARHFERSGREAEALGSGAASAEGGPP